MAARKNVLSGVALKGYADIFAVTASSSEQITELALRELHAFAEHPFRVRDDEEMEQLKASIIERGVREPIVVRPRRQGGYELIAGHRRCRACELAGKETIPAIVRDLDDDEAVIEMVDSNDLRRQTLLPSERAFAYRMRYEAMKRRGRGKSVSQDGTEKAKRSDAVLAEEVGESRNQLQRYMRLTWLCAELLDMVDEKRIPVSAAVELSYLTAEAQQWLCRYLAQEGMTISVSHGQAERIRAYASEGELTHLLLREVMSTAKKKTRVTLSGKKLARYFPEDYDGEKMEETILALLEAWQAQREKEV